MDKPDRLSWLRSLDPGVLILPILGFMLIAAGLITLYFVGQVPTLSCTREAASRPSCNLITTWMDLTELSVRPVPQLTAAYVQESCDEDGCTYRIMLSTTFGDLPLTSIYSSGEVDKQLKVNQVNSFIQDSSQNRLKVSEGGGLFILIPVIFVGVGLYLCSAALFNAIKRLITDR